MNTAARAATALAVALLGALPAAPGAATPADGVDPATGLRRAPGWRLVAGLCTQCHSSAIIRQQRADRETWREMIRWMQRTQGLWPLPPETEGEILDYLAGAYGPAPAYRRPPLPPALMPPPPDGPDGS